ncbi:MAG: hypothetical protein HOP08_05730 [Cyclobacteriaceae bacterium]|nr:hypothetical protein [Cyclobacteriaceae bacterium]
MVTALKLAALKKKTLLSSGRTVTETEEEAQKIIDKLHINAFSKGIPMFYNDNRTDASTQFIRANPDGSEDLVNFNSANGEYTLLSNLVPIRKGRWSQVLHT